MMTGSQAVEAVTAGARGFGRYNFGRAILTARTVTEAVMETGLDFTVAAAPLFLGNGQEVDAGQAVVRTDTGAVLGVVGPSYEPVQIRDAFATVDPLVSEGLLRLHSAGMFDGGRRVWLVLEVPERTILPGGDTIVRYVLVVLSHDGTTAVRMAALPFRLICQNGLMAALGDEAAVFQIRHTVTANARLGEATRVLRGVEAFYRDFGTRAAQLAGTRFRDDQMARVAAGLFAAEAGHDPTPATIRAREAVVELFREGTGHGGIAGTAWAAVNAVAEYADHRRSVRAGVRSEGEARTFGTWFGGALQLKRRAWPLIAQEIAQG
jgi:phage/plasmid-like protein (TIGR03299 family)